MRIFHLLLALCCTGAIWADTVTMKNGSTINGTFLGGTPREIKMEVGGQIQVISVSDINTLVFGGEVAPPPPPPPPAQAQQMPPQQAPPPQQMAGGGMMLPAGTNIVVRMIDSVDSDRARVGDSFRASLDEPIYANGQIVAQRGAEAQVRLVDAKESGKLAGRSTLTMSLQAVNVNGRMVEVNTQSVTQESSSRGARTAKVTAGTTALGATIGAIAGGGRGAAIGAGAGAATGVGAEVMTKGQRVRIPSETRLRFRLDSAVTI